MLYFKTTKGRLIVQCKIDENSNVYWLLTPGGDMSLYQYTISHVSEVVWKKLERYARPNILENSPDDLAAYETAWKEQDEFEQDMADLDWQMSMAYHYRM